jgi:hypothetical protein
MLRGALAKRTRKGGLLDMLKRVKIFLIEVAKIFSGLGWRAGGVT